MTKFNSSYDPPAPTARIAIRNPETGKRLKEIEMILDTGSDITLLPRSSVDILGVLPFGKANYYLTGFDGSTVIAEVFTLQAIFLGKRFTGNYCVLDDSIGILGRDILNQLSILLDGPNLEWEEITTPPI